MDVLLVIIGVANLVLLVVLLVKQMQGAKIDTDGIVSSVKDGLNESQRSLREEVSGSVQSSVKSMGDSLVALQKELGERQSESDLRVENRVMESGNVLGTKIDGVRTLMTEKLQGMLGETLSNFGTVLQDTQKQAGDSQRSQFELMEKKLTGDISAMHQAVLTQQEQSGKAVQEHLVVLEQRFQTLEASNNDRLATINRTMQEHLDRLSETNQQKLDSIQAMVSDKLETRLRDSFNTVSERLEKVYIGLGEMQSIATGVGDLKKVLAGVKTRGILGEVQLGMILGEILAPELYDCEVATIKGSSNRVEFAVKLPGQDGKSTVYLPIDSKFPGDTYQHLLDAYDSGDTARIEEAKHALAQTIKKCASDIKEKYVAPPYTTAFGVMFLPFEGLYAEVVNSGLVEVLQRDYSITITGPSTMAAMLNSLQMGFKTLALQKQSSEVWRVLGEAKGEFEKFEGVLKSTQDKLRKAGDDLEKLVGTRTRAITRKLRDVEALTYSDDAGVASTTGQALPESTDTGTGTIGDMFSEGFNLSSFLTEN